MRRLMGTTAVWLFVSSASSSAQIPHITGTVEIDLAHGVLTGDLCIARLPALLSYQFALNRGLNVKRVRDARGRMIRYADLYDGTIVGDGLLYRLRDTLGSAVTLCVSYTGAYPVYDVRRGDFAHVDSKGLIAFNGLTVRAAEQPMWYPVLRDSAGDRLYTQVTYDLRVRCRACRSIYVNGAPPQDTRGRGEASFRIDAPVAPLIFGGDFAFHERAGTWFVNSELAESTARILTGLVAEVKRFYEGLTGVPYGGAITFLQHEPIEKYASGRWWGFVTYPTIALAGRTFASYVDDTARTLAPSVWPFLGHEMGHWYFGSRFVPRGTYRWFFLESLPEYLALRAIRRFVGDSAFAARLASHARAARADTTLVPLDRITAARQITGTYRYAYGPVLLVTLERTLGEERMSRLLNAIVTAPEDVPRDYAFLERAALAAGTPESVWQEWRQRCVAVPAAVLTCAGVPDARR